MAEKMLYFMEQTNGQFDAAQDMVTYPLSSFQGFSASGTQTTLLLHFSGVLGQDEDAYDVVTLTITSDKHKEVVQALTQAFNEGPHSDGFIVVADDANSVYADSRITACSIAATAVD
tara:strand:+ start:89 stop:439 length:351 start_codon:yes stop_codon:yes gene_type:complete